MNGTLMNHENNGKTEVSSLWEQFQLNNEEILDDNISVPDIVNMKQQCSDLILFVNGK